MRTGVAHHLGWAVLVTATPEHRVVDRRRIELVDGGLPAAPVHHEGGAHALHRTGPVLDDAALAELVGRVRRSAIDHARRELSQLAADVDRPIVSISLRGWPDDFPTDIATLRVPPHESRADSVMYRAVLAEIARELGWGVDLFDAATVERDASAILGDRAHEVLHGPRAELGPPWTKDHRIALAATVCAEISGAGSGRGT
jgi:hypothetical protein